MSRFVEELERAHEVAPTQRDFAVEALEYSGSGKVRAQVVAADNGCESSDFRNVRGKIALIRRGDCFFMVKARNAATAGAAAAIISNNEPGTVDATLVEPGIGIPVVSVTRDVGSTLAGATVELEIRARTVRTSINNVIADAPRAPRAPTLMLGAHLDSVPAGAGIDDNASGVAALIEIAKALQRVEPRHQVRFGFWGAEESGLHGSRAFVRVPANRRAVVGYLNFDMLGAKNYARQVYQGPLAYVFTRYFSARGLSSQTIDIEGRSDHASFDAAGIPTGGLFSGGDPCYHQRCDRIPNVNMRALGELPTQPPTRSRCSSRARSSASVGRRPGSSAGRRAARRTPG